MRTKKKALKRKVKAPLGVKKVALLVTMGGGAAICLFFMSPIYNKALPAYLDAINKASWKEFWPAGAWLTLFLIVLASGGWVWLALAQSVHAVLKRHLFGWVTDPPKKFKVPPAKRPTWWGDGRERVSILKKVFVRWRKRT